MAEAATETESTDLRKQMGGWALGAFASGGETRPKGVYRSESPATQNIKVIDVDCHLSEPADLWKKGVPASMRDRAPYLAVHDGMEYWMIGDTPVSVGGASVIKANGDKLLGRFGMALRSEVHPATYDVASRVAMMDELGVWGEICYPNSFQSASATLLKWYDKDFAENMIRIYNDYCAESQKSTGGRVIPMALLPVWDSKAMEKEARRCVDLGLKGFNLPDRPEQFEIPSMIKDHWAPLFELCNATGMPINFHIATGGVDGYALVWDGFEFERKLAVGSMLFYVGNAATIANFIISGLFDKYPKLKMVSVESGVGWIPFVLDALEYQVDEMMPTKKLQKRPSEYYRDNMFASFWFENRGLKRVLEELGTDNVMFETDFPHPTSIYPDPQTQIETSIGQFDFATRRKLLQDNAVRCYNLKL